MTGKQLRNSILQWAIQGKLVPQDPSDEPASVLLEQIRVEKARLVKEKIIKHDKNETIIYRGEDNSYYEKTLATGAVRCIDDEIPFEIPSSWAWCRLEHIIDFSKSQSIKNDDINKDAWLLDLEDIEKDTGKLLRKKRMKDVNAKSDKHPFEKGNVLYSKLRPYLNKVIIADEDGVCTSEILAFDFTPIFNRYAQVYLMSPFFVEHAMSDAYGVKMPRLGSKQGNAALMPIPPITEQIRIVDRIDAITPLVLRYSDFEINLNRLNSSITDILKKSILQEAIQGKLVPQIESEGTAEELLAEIQSEKMRLVKEGKLKKSAIANESRIFRGDDNKYYEQIGSKVVDITGDIPFEIPPTWIWCRFGTIVKMRIGKTPPRGEQVYWSNGKHNWVSISDMVEGGTIKAVKEKVSDIAVNEIFKCYPTPKGSLLMSFKLTVGRTSILGVDAYHNEAIITIVPYADVNNIFRDYLFYILPTISNSGDSKDAIKGKTLNNKSLNNLLIPLPPLLEQKRIVTKIELVNSKIKG